MAALGLVLGAVLFAGMTVMLWVGYSEAEKAREEEPLRAEPLQAAARDGDRCLLCDQPLRRRVTRTEVVDRLEREIGIETAAVMRALQQPSVENLARLYDA